jgi:pyrimidine 5'-nucleotidase
MKLYFQRSTDLKVKRRLLKGCSSGDLDKYGLRTKPKVVFFDCDDTLYFDDWKTANQLTANIEKWCVEKVALPPGKAYELYKHYGTALRGLLAEGYVENNQHAVDAFLEEVHDLPIHQFLKPDNELREILLKMDPAIPKYIFTASVSHHAERCIKALGIDDLFEDVVIDVKQCNLETKHSRHSFDAAMKIAGVDDPEACIFLDDSLKNIEAARKIGWRGVLVGRVGRDCGKPISSDHAELEIDRIHDIRQVLPELFIDELN